MIKLHMMESYVNTYVGCLNMLAASVFAADRVVSATDPSTSFMHEMFLTDLIMWLLSIHLFLLLKACEVYIYSPGMLKTSEQLKHCVRSD